LKERCVTTEVSLLVLIATFTCMHAVLFSLHNFVVNVWYGSFADKLIGTCQCDLSY